MGRGMGHPTTSTASSREAGTQQVLSHGRSAAPPQCLRPPWHQATVASLGHRIAKGAPSAKPSPSWGKWGAAPLPGVTPSRGYQWGVAVPGGVTGRLQLAEDETLVVGRHIHLEARSRGQGVPTGTGTPPTRTPQLLPSSQGAARWPQPTAAAALCPEDPRQGC